MENGAHIKRKKWIESVLAACFWLCVWQVAALLADNSLLFAGPADTAAALCRGIVTAKFWQSIRGSVIRILCGFFCAVAVGGVLAAAAFRWRFAERLLSPFMTFCKAVPVAAFSVILLIWLGGERLSAVIALLVALPIVYVNVYEGLSHADPKLAEMAAVFEMPRFNRIFYLYRPALAPFAESCLRTGMGMSIKAGIAAEVIGMAERSIGGRLYEAKIYLDTAGVFAWTAVVILLSACMEWGVLFLWRGFCRWKPQPHAGRRSAGRQHTGGQGIVLEKISKAYGKKQVLTEFSARWEPGSVHCLMAPSGSGKTTLLRLLAGLERPDGGEFESGDKIAMVFQEDRLCEEEPALCNVELVCKSRQAARACLEALLPGEDLEQKVSALSGGMRRRVCLARALAAESEVLLLDEPFTGLDGENRDNAARVIREWQRGRTMVVASHEAEDAERLSGEIRDMQKEWKKA